MTGERSGCRQDDGGRTAMRWATWARAVPLLLGAALLVAAGETASELRVEALDDTRHPVVSVVLSAPGLESEDPASSFEVTQDGTAVPVDAAAVPPGAVEVVLVVAEPAPGVDIVEVRSVVLDFVLRMPPATRISIIGTAPRPEVLAEPGATLQSRVVAANQVGQGGPMLEEALDLALRQFSEAGGRVRSIVVVGGENQREALPEGLSSAFAQRHVAVHGVQPGSADQLIARLTSLYRLTFEVREGTGEVALRLAADGGPDAVAVTLPAPATAGAAPGEAAGDTDTRPGASPPGGSGWPVLLAVVAALGVMLMSASIVLPSVAARRHKPGTGSWERAATRVAGEIGAGEEVSVAAERIARQRRGAASEIWSAGRETRLAATVLAVQPLVVGGLVLLIGRGDARVAADSWSGATLIVPVLLAVAGAVWLRRVARPPFSAWPPRWHAHDREAGSRQRTADTLDLAHLYAAGGLSLEESLARAGAGWHEHPARLLEKAHTGDTEDAPAADLLAAGSAAVRWEQVTAARERARGGIAATAVPFLLCTLPASILLFLASWPRLTPE